MRENGEQFRVMSPRKDKADAEAIKRGKKNGKRRVKKVEWIIQDISHKKTVYDTGECLHSPEFTVNLGGAGVGD